MLMVHFVVLAKLIAYITLAWVTALEHPPIRFNHASHRCHSVSTCPNPLYLHFFELVYEYKLKS
jgi:hypothetical protein